VFSASAEGITKDLIMIDNERIDVISEFWSPLVSLAQSKRVRSVSMSYQQGGPGKLSTFQVRL
jgi:hypothetical protein